MPSSPTSTILCEIMGRYGSDKGGVNLTRSWHTYTPYYHALFDSIRNLPLRVFELGLGTNFTDVPSNMGRNGHPGASHYGWREYFPRATIHGADIDTRILFQSNRIRTVWCDQRSPTAIASMWRELDPDNEGYDIMIEDGLHTLDTNVCCFENSIDHLRIGGYYIIEDCHTKQRKLYEQQLVEWRSKFPNYEFTWVKLFSKRNKFDNNLIQIKRCT